MEYKDRKKVYVQAIEQWGAEAQLVIALEELNECGKEICKVLRGQGDMAHLAEEVADATIMLEQVRIMFHINDLVQQEMERKILRLEHRIEACKNPVKCIECEFSRTESSCLRCINDKSEYEGCLVTLDSSCRHGVRRYEKK